MEEKVVSRCGRREIPPDMETGSGDGDGTVGEEEKEVKEDGGGSTQKSSAIEMAPFTGDFDSWEEFDDAVAEYSSSTQQILIKRTSETVEYRNSIIKKSKAYLSGIRGMLVVHIATRLMYFFHLTH